jgi:thymidylate synthase
MILNPDKFSVLEFGFSDFELIGYNPDPHIKAEISA